MTGFWKENDGQVSKFIFFYLPLSLYGWIHQLEFFSLLSNWQQITSKTKFMAFKTFGIIQK